MVTKSGKQKPEIWPSGKSVRFRSCKLEFNSESGLTNKEFGIHSFPCLKLSIKGNSVENKPASLLVMQLGKALSGIAHLKLVDE